MSVFICLAVFMFTVFLLGKDKDCTECVCQSTEADYERVAVEAYGLAMLRGMGWNKAEGIGRTFKE